MFLKENKYFEEIFSLISAGKWEMNTYSTMFTGDDKGQGYKTSTSRQSDWKKAEKKRTYGLISSNVTYKLCVFLSILYQQQQQGIKM